MSALFSSEQFASNVHMTNIDRRISKTKKSHLSSFSTTFEREGLRIHYSSGYH